MLCISNQKLRIAAAFSSLFICLCFGKAHAQRTPRPTPTPATSTQIQTGTTRTGPEQVWNDKSNQKVNTQSHGSVVSNESDGSGGSEPAGAGRITKIIITVTTGDDDLRQGSALSPFIVTRNGKRIQSANPLNCYFVGKDQHCSGISDGTQRTFEWTDFVQADTHQTLNNIDPADIYRFGLSFGSGTKYVVDTPDNWNLNKLEVEYVVEVSSNSLPAGTYTMFKGSGKPLYRFKNNEEWRTDPLKLPQ